MKNLSKKGKIGVIVAVIIAILVIGFAIVMTQRVDSAEAQQIALSQTGGGEVVSEQVSSEGLWNEYSYVIVNGEKWYEIEITGFGNVSEIESGTGQYPVD